MITFTTINFNIIQELCKDALTNSKMIALIGYPGAGKTVGLKYFSDNNREKVIYIVVRKSMSTKDFYIELLNAVGYEGENNQSSIYIIMNMIIFKIKNCKSKILLIIDEAGKFKSGQLEYIHELRDQTIDKLGIVLSGPEYFYDNLYSWKERSIIGIPEVFRRIQVFENMIPLSFAEIKGICNAYGITNIKLINNKFKDSENFSDLHYKINDYFDGNN